MVESRTGEFKRGARALFGATIGAGCGLSSISFYTHGVFVPAIVSDTGWSRGDVQLGVTIMILMAVVSAPLAGTLIDKFGARRIALCAIPLYGITLASFALVNDSLWTYYAAWCVMSLLAAGTLPITWTRVVTAWFDNSRGLALGITLAGTGIAATFAPAYVSSLIEQSGWRIAYLLLAVTITLIALPTVFAWFRDPPKLTASNTSEHTTTQRGSLTSAIQSYRFWLMAIGILLVAAGIGGLITNAFPMLTDQGINAGEAARYMGLIGVSVITGRLVVGILLDRFWAPLIAAVFLAAPCVSALIFASDSLSPTTITVAVLIVGLAAGAELDLMAFLVSRYFGLASYGAVYGALYVFFSVGAGIAPFAFGKAYDLFGSYDPILAIVAGMSVAGAALLLMLGPYPIELAKHTTTAETMIRAEP
ncbi:MAG: MFS transporter [Pseudomonadota bacterium]